MAERNFSEEAREAAERLLAAYGWQLLAPDTFGVAVAALLADAPDLAARRAALQVYAAALHRACSGDEGCARQEQGYRELADYLARAARRYDPAVRADALQHAIEATFVRFASCRKPSAFLAFALQKLRDACRAEHHRAAGLPLALDSLPGGAMVSCNELDNPPECALLAEQRRLVLQHIHTALRRHPRAQRQVAALWLRCVEGLDDQAIGARLGAPTGAVQVLRSRGVALLRRDPDLRALAAEYGIGPAIPASMGVG